MRPRFYFASAALLVLFAALNLYDDWTLEIMPIKFVVCAILAGLTYLIAVTDFAGSGRGAFWTFWIITLALRVLALPLHPAGEVWRHQTDGLLQRSGINPYAVAPADGRVAEVTATLPSLSHASETASFAPGAELLFRVLPPSSNALLYKLLFGVAELLAILLFLRLTDVGSAAWLGWNPLMAYSFFGAAHFDSILLLAVTGLLTCLVGFERERRWQFAAGAAIASGFAIALRPVSIVMLLPAAFALRRYAPVLLLSFLVPLLCALPFGLSHAWPNLYGDFVPISRLNDLFWWLLEETVLPNWHEQYFRYAAVILIVCGVVAAIFARNWRRGLLWSMGLALILAPALHAWYITWILPVATWRRAYAWHMLSVTIFTYYLFFNERLFALPWHAEPWMRGAIVLPVIFALVLLAWQQRSARRPS